VEQRAADARAILGQTALDGWVATASGDGVEHLVPLSVVWDGERLVLATDPSSTTARNLAASGRARIGLGGTRDVVMVEATVEATLPVPDAPDELAERYAAQSDWDPRASIGEFVYVVLRPRRVQAWREADEIAGRTVMRDGAWLA
jgi:hypothetical protein